MRRNVWIAAWLAAGVPLLVASTDLSRSYFLMLPVWITFAPWAWRRFGFFSRRIMFGYTAMLCVAYLCDPGFSFDYVPREGYSHTLIFGCVSGLVIAVSRYGLGPDSPVGDRIVRTAAMTIALILLVMWFASPRIR